MIFSFRKNFRRVKVLKGKTPNAELLPYFDIDDSKLFRNFVYSAVSEKIMKPIR